MARAHRPSLYTIPLDRAFADTLVRGVAAIHGAKPLDLARGMILLPNARAVVAVRDAFIRYGGQAMLLPRLVSLGDGDLDQAAGAALDRLDTSTAPNPPIEPLHRQLLLARTIMEIAADTPVTEAMRLATSLAQVIDQLRIEQVELSQLCDFVPQEDMAEHWDSAFALLQQVLDGWQDRLGAIGLVDRTDERNRLLDATAQIWAEHGLPVAFVIAAGITTSAPAIARLLSVIASSEGGAVVLPHVDTAMDALQWDALGGDPSRQALDGPAPHFEETHPQYHLKLLLDRMGLHRDEVAIWPGVTSPIDPMGRTRFVGTMMAAAAFTDDWPEIPPAKRKLPGVTLYDLATPDQEALTIALAMREALDTPGKTAALVTSDRTIAARVAAQLTRWGIVADDSAGVPLSNSAPGELVLALLDAAASNWAPVELIALLSHPLVASGEDRREWLDRVRELDLLLRGPRPATGLDDVAALIASQQPASGALVAWWAALMAVVKPLDGAASAPLTEQLASLRAALAALAGDGLWSGAAGRALAQFYGDLERHAALIVSPIMWRDASAMLRSLMREVPVRAPYGGHPRLFIWGLIEARLQRADRMILAGLNEGQWPQRPSFDPWLPPLVRRRLGLPGIERQTGLSAHDFTCALGADEVIITRSQRDGGTPTVASRLRLRLDALLGKDAVTRASAGPHAPLASLLDACAQPRPVSRPSLAPPPAKRPRRISVTQVDTLRADPFAFYANNALGLRRLDRLDAEPTAAWRGTAVHLVLERWLKGGEWTLEAAERQLNLFLDGPGITPTLRAIWTPRLRAALANFVRMTLAGLGAGRVPIIPASEVRGTIVMGEITLSGKADRIDRMADGTLAIVDYKTGSSPAKAAVEAGYALQLGLLGAMAQAGAFPDTGGQVAAFEYWRANRDDKTRDFGWVDSPFYSEKARPDRRMDEESFAAEARAITEQVFARYLTGGEDYIAKLAPLFAPYADYDQLMRLEEWYGRDGHDPDAEEERA